MNKGGRPRSKNFEKNLAKRIRQKESLPPLGDFRKSIIHNLTKSFFSHVNTEKIAGRASKPVYNYEEVSFITDGVMLRNPLRPSFQDLRTAAYGTSIIGAIHKLRVDDLGVFAESPTHFTFRMAHAKEKPTKKDEAMIHFAETFFQNMGEKVEGWSKRDRLKTVTQMMIRDTLTIDAICFYLVTNRVGKLIEIKYLDPATIFQIDRNKGFRGDTSVGWVQIIDNTVVETFKHDQILMRHQNALSDVRYRGTGLSPTETSIMELVGVINALKYNRQRFTNNPPPGFFSVSGNPTQEVMDSLGIQWNNMWSNNENNFEIPMIGSGNENEVKWTPLNIQNEMAFDKLMQWLLSLTLTAHGVDQAELGLNLLGSQKTFSEGSPDGRIQTSMTRSKRAILSYFCDVFNELKDLREELDGLRHIFNGIDPEDEDKKLDREDKLVKSTNMIDSIRARRDEPTLGEEMRTLYNLTDEEYERVKFSGAVILDPNWNQTVGATLAQKISGQEPGQPGQGAPGVGGPEPEAQPAPLDFIEDDLLLPA